MVLELKIKSDQEVLVALMANQILHLNATDDLINDLPSTPILNTDIKDTLNQWINTGFSDEVPLHVRGMLISCYETCCKSSHS